MASISSLIRSFLIAIIRVYRYISHAILGPSCRFEPTCSAYAIEALKLHGCIKGLFLIFFRLLRCHPWHNGGFDPVPKHNRSRIC